MYQFPTYLQQFDNKRDILEYENKINREIEAILGDQPSYPPLPSSNSYQGDGSRNNCWYHYVTMSDSRVIYKRTRKVFIGHHFYFEGIKYQIYLHTYKNSNWVEIYTIFLNRFMW